MRASFNLKELRDFGFLIFGRSKIPGFMGLCLFPALNNEDFVMCAKTRFIAVL